MTMLKINPAGGEEVPDQAKATEAQVAKAAKEMSAARTILLAKSPFISTLALSMKMEITEMIPTAATDGRRLLFNPLWVLGLTREQQVGLLAHEAMHPALDHCNASYRGHRDPETWNIAGDHIINNILTQAKFEIPPGGCCDPKYGNGEWSTVSVYDDIAKQKDKGKGKGPGGVPGTGSDIIEATGEADKALQEEIKARVATAANTARMSKEYGNLPGQLKRLIDEVLNPKLDWRSLLRRFMSERAKDDYSFKRPNKRFHDVFMPSLYSESFGHIVLVIDTSGSVDNEMLKQFIGEIEAIRQEVKPVRTTVMCCDTQVHNAVDFEPDESILSYQPGGGGGTSFRPPFRWVEKHCEEPPVCLVYFTDMYGDFPDDPGYPVLWAAWTDIVGPFGETVRIEI